MIFIIRSIEKLTGYDLITDDGDIGEVEDFYLDSNELIVRYVVVDTGGWLTGRKVVISSDCIKDIECEKSGIIVDLTKEEIEDSPTIDEKKPVSRQDEKDLVDHYDWPAYWTPVTGTLTAGYGGADYPTRPTPLVLDDDDNPLNPIKNNVENKKESQKESDGDGDCYLRSAKEIDGYTIHAKDGKIGHLENILVNEESWMVHYLVIDTRNWLPGREVIVAPEWLDRISYTAKDIYVNLYKETIKNSPEYESDIPVSRDYEEELYEHYNQNKYWKED